jgi:hypothetical protein
VRAVPPALVAAALALVACSAASPSTAVETPRWSQSFVDSVGVNVHLHYTDRAYVTQWPLVKHALIVSGIKHVRDGLFDTRWQPYYAHLSELGRAGIGVTLIASLGETADVVRAYRGRLSAIDAFEGPNEVDLANVDGWPQRLRSFQEILWRSVRDGGSNRVPVVGPSLTTTQAYAALGDLSAFEDFGNMHDYPGGRNPGTGGWGMPAFGSRYGSIAYNLASAAQASRGRPILSTETGYHDDLTDAQSVPADVMARYVPRVFLEHFAAGVPRTFEYEFVDEGIPGREGHFGLLDGDVRPKAAFRALSALLARLADPGPKVEPRPIEIALSAGAQDVHHQLFAKGDHSVSLLLWREVPAYDVVRHASLRVDAVRVTAALPAGGAAGASAERFADDGSLARVELQRSGGGVSLVVDDHVTILSFLPNGHTSIPNDSGGPH